jgi:hypothetical protein
MGGDQGVLENGLTLRIFWTMYWAIAEAMTANMHGPDLPLTTKNIMWQPWARWDLSLDVTVSKEEVINQAFKLADLVTPTTRVQDYVEFLHKYTNVLQRYFSKAIDRLIFPRDLREGGGKKKREKRGGKYGNHYEDSTAGGSSPIWTKEQIRMMTLGQGGYGPPGGEELWDLKSAGNNNSTGGGGHIPGKTLVIHNSDGGGRSMHATLPSLSPLPTPTNSSGADTNTNDGRREFFARSAGGRIEQTTIDCGEIPGSIERTSHRTCAAETSTRRKVACAQPAGIAKHINFISAPSYATVHERLHAERKDFHPCHIKRVPVDLHAYMLQPSVVSLGM